VTTVYRKAHQTYHSSFIKPVLATGYCDEEKGKKKEGKRRFDGGKKAKIKMGHQNFLTVADHPGARN